jgi:hypothetical protein
MVDVGSWFRFMLVIIENCNQNIQPRTIKNVLRDCKNTSTFTINTDERVVTDLRNGSSQATLVSNNNLILSSFRILFTARVEMFQTIGYNYEKMGYQTSMWFYKSFTSLMGIFVYITCVLDNKRKVSNLKGTSNKSKLSSLRRSLSDYISRNK